MSISIKSKQVFDEDYKYIRKKEYYEPMILSIMNDSKIVFPSTYKYIKKQDNKEPDFIDEINGTKYDAKLLFENHICLALKEKDFGTFMVKLQDMVCINIPIQRESGPKNTMLYAEMEKRINTLEPDESGILFLPFPILMSLPESFTDLCSDQFDWCFAEMKCKKTVYLIGMNILGMIVCKQLGSYGRTEYLKNIYFDKWFNTELINCEKIA